MSALSDKWFNSQLLNDNIMDEECLAEHPIYIEYIDALTNLHVTQENYKKLIALSDYLMIDNPDALIDQIMKIHDYDYDMIYKFKDFYRYNTKRLIPFETTDALNSAIELYCEDHIKCFHTYGFTSFWDVSKITDMSWMFYNRPFYGDISKWNISNLTNIDNMF